MVSLSGEIDLDTAWILSAIPTPTSIEAGIGLYLSDVSSINLGDEFASFASGFEPDAMRYIWDGGSAATSFDSRSLFAGDMGQELARKRSSPPPRPAISPTVPVRPVTTVVVTATRPSLTSYLYSTFASQVQNIYLSSSRRSVEITNVTVYGQRPLMTQEKRDAAFNLLAETTIRTLKLTNIKQAEAAAEILSTVLLAYQIKAISEDELADKLAEAVLVLIQLVGPVILAQAIRAALLASQVGAIPAALGGEAIATGLALAFSAYTSSAGGKAQMVSFIRSIIDSIAGAM